MKTEKKYELKVDNGHHQFSFDDTQLDALDIVKTAEGQYHLLDNNQSYLAEIIETDFANKQFIIKINGTVHSIDIADQYDMLVEKMGLSAENLTKVSNVKAPMPGLVLSVKVKVGQDVVAGDQLLILEAMKMENVLKSPGEGTVKSISIEEGQAVDKGQVLIEME